MSDRHGDWIECYTGRRVWPLDLRPDDIDIRDIAHALACLNRYTGHTIQPINIAQHSCIVAALVPAEHRLWALLHDAAEAYLNDVARPLKQMPEFSFYREAESRAMRTICERFGLPPDMPAEVKAADNIALKAEAKVLMAGKTENWSKWIEEVPDPPAGVVLEIRPTWGWWYAERMFLTEFSALTGDSVRT